MDRGLICESRTTLNRIWTGPPGNVTKFAVILALLAVSYVMTYYFSVVLKTDTVFTHFFYVPIILSSMWWRWKGLVVALLLSLLLLLDAMFSGVSAPVSENAARIAMFVVISVVVSTMSELMSRARKTLQQSEERYRRLFENAPDGIFQITTEGRILSANPALAEIHGYATPEELMKSVTNAPSGLYCYPPEPAELIRRLNEENLVRGFEMCATRKDGSTGWVSVNARTIRDPEGRITYYEGMAQDITVHKNLEARLMLTRKMEAVGTLAGGIAHDFNNLLMGIQGYTSLMLLHRDPDDPDYAKLKKIEEQVQSGANLTGQLLAFARGGRYELKTTNLNGIIEKTSEMLGRTKRDITIVTKLQKDLWATDVDRARIEQALVKLYLNGAEAMPGGGRLEIETSNVVLDEDETDLSEAKPGKYVKVSVSDTGHGMNEEMQERIFDPFFTTKEMGRRGVGLGLASVYGIVKSHKGVIRVNSREGQGTTFSICLPASEKAEPSEPEPPEEAVRGSRTILLVDDEEVVLDVTRELLETLGYKVYVANTGRNAVELYKEHQVDIDLIILDLIMPDMGGGETFDLLKSVNPGVKVILSSGYSVDGKAREILEHGAVGFMQKPFTMESLSEKIGSVFGEQG